MVQGLSFRGLGCLLVLNGASSASFQLKLKVLNPELRAGTFVQGIFGPG